MSSKLKGEDNIYGQNKREICEMRAAIYTRSATGNGEHLNVQAERCTTFAAEHGYSVVEIYNDTIQSGMANDGLALTRMMNDANHGRFDAVIIEDISRLSRRTERMTNL